MDFDLFPGITPETITEEMIQALQTNLQTNEGSYTRDILSSLALSLYNAYKTMNRLIPLSFVDETSGEYLVARAGEYGITRKDGTASSVSLEFAGQNDTEIPKGTTVGTAGGLLFSTDETVKILEGKAAAPATSQGIGEIYNLPPDTILNIVTPVSGLQSVRNPTAAIGGSDPESDESLYNRLDLYRKQKATSGNVADYEQWALSVPGVGAVQVLPLWDGNGTVKVMIASPEKKPVDEDIVSDCKEYIESVRPIGASVTVESAAALTVSISAVVVLAESAVLETVKTDFSAQAEEYLQSIALEKDTVPYNRLAFLLLNVEGIENFTSFSINGAEEDIPISSGFVPVLGEVEITQ